MKYANIGTQLAGLSPINEYNISTGIPPSPKCFSFGFEYWRQIEYFNVGSTRIAWFVSLISRLKEMGKEVIEEVKKGKKGYRFHPINWVQKNIPIKKEIFATRDWLGEKFFEDNELFQFQVSTGSGRVIGFFDDQEVFQIVLLDVDHNAQPSKKNGYKLTRNIEERSEYAKLVQALNQKSVSCRSNGCEECLKWSELEKGCIEQYDGKTSLVLGLEPSVVDAFFEICEVGTSPEDIMELGLAAYKE